MYCDEYKIYPEDAMPYMMWCERFGKYRWYHEDGTPRTYYPLDYNWKTIYDKVTKSADIAFSYRIIYDTDLFTSEFLANVPLAWMKFKTELEMLAGTLDGKNINPDIFEQGYERNRTYEMKTNGTAESNVNRTDTDGTRTDNNKDVLTESGNRKTRDINYEQGVQEYDKDISQNTLDRDYASAMVDHTESDSRNKTDNTTFTKGEQKNSSELDSNGTTNENTEYSEYDRMKRINYYDNLAFLRERVDRLRDIRPFYTMFEYLFNKVESFNGWW